MVKVLSCVQELGAEIIYVDSSSGIVVSNFKRVFPEERVPKWEVLEMDDSLFEELFSRHRTYDSTVFDTSLNKFVKQRKQKKAIKLTLKG